MTDNIDHDEAKDLIDRPELALEGDEGASRKRQSLENAKVYRWLKDRYERTRLPRRYRLIAEDDVLQNSIQAVRFSVLCSSINTKMLNPNYPIMVEPGAHPDSFPDTEPFNFNAATYFLPMCSLLGVAIASVFLGQISDKVGRKRVILVLAWISAVGSVVKYFTTETFWGFCITQMVFGFFLGNLPVAMAYVGDVFTSKKEKEKELGVLVSFFVIGNSGGGIIAILMNDSGLFAPLWVGAATLGLSAVFTSWYMVEAQDLPRDDVIDTFNKRNDDEIEVVRPETIDQKALWNIVAGAVFDNFGSTALFPLCLSPLAIEQYLFDFVNAEPPEDPIMSVTGYQWLSVCVAFMVVPSTLITPFIFRKFGVAGTCVFGNMITALVTTCLLLIGNAAATPGMFGAFVFVMYAGFPMTVLSQLTTSPMLDVIAPIDKIGYVQGMNNAAMNFGMAVAPWLFGILADSTSTNIAIITGIGISVLAAVVNCPLTFDSRFGRAKELAPAAKRVLSHEDSDFVECALAGELVDQESLMLANFERMKGGTAPIIPRVKSYEEDKDNGFDELSGYAELYFDHRMMLLDRMLVAISDSNDADKAKEICDLLNTSLYGDAPSTKEASDNLGQWIGKYLLDAGYNPHTNPNVIKQMILTALPPITFDKKFTPENLEPALLRARNIAKKYGDTNREIKKNQWTFADALGKGGTAVFYS